MAKIEITRLGAQFETRLDPVVLCIGLGGLKRPGNGRSVGAHLLEIDGGDLDLDVVKTKLLALSNNLSWRED